MDKTTGEWKKVLHFTWVELKEDRKVCFLGYHFERISATSSTYLIMVYSINITLKITILTVTKLILGCPSSHLSWILNSLSKFSCKNVPDTVCYHQRYIDSDLFLNRPFYEGCC